MADLQELMRMKDALSAIDAELETKQKDFERSVAELREKRASLRRDYAAALRHELAGVGGDDASSTPRRRAPRGSAAKPDPDAILQALQRAQEPVSADRIRELAGIDHSISPNSLSSALKTLVEEGQVVRTGERRGTKYHAR